jgi:hypothetical protein
MDPSGPINIYHKLKQRLEKHISDVKFLDAKLVAARRTARTTLNGFLYTLSVTVCMSSIVACYVALGIHNAPLLLYIAVSWLVAGVATAFGHQTFLLFVGRWGAASFDRCGRPYATDLDNLIAQCDLAIEMFGLDPKVPTVKYATKLTHQVNYELDIIRRSLAFYGPNDTVASSAAAEGTSYLVPNEYLELCGGEQA